MSHALVEHRDGVLFGTPASADTPVATIQIKRAPEYEPDATAYAFNPQNDEIAKLRALVEKREVTLDVSVATNDGRRERIRLDESDTASWLGGDYAARRAIANRKILERHVSVAATAAARHVAGQPMRVTPEEEACLREFGAVVERRVAREGKHAHGYDRVPFIRESVRRRASRADLRSLREDFFDSELASDGAYGQYVTPSQREYLPRGGPAAEQQTIGDVWDALAKSRYAYTHDPIVRHGCHILADFVVGRGVSIVAKHPVVQKLVDEFVDRTKLNDALHPLAVSLSRDGELFVRMMPLGDGRMKIAELHPATIWEITTDAEDVRDVYQYHQRYQTRTQLFTSDIPAAQMRYIERVIPATEVLHVRVNASEWDIRGRSDVFPALGWAKRLRDYFDAEVAKAKASASYQWHYKVKGGAGDVSSIAGAVSGGEAPPGSSFVTNDGVDVSAVASGTSATAKEGGTYEALINHIAVAFGLSKDYFGAASRNTRASALIATEPAAKRFEQRQGVIAAFLENLMRAVIAEHKKHGRLVAGPNDTPIVEDFRVVFPTIITADSATRITQLGTALGGGVISHKRYAEEVAGEAEFSDYDYDAEQKAIESEIGIPGWKITTKDAAPVKRGLPDLSDAAFDPGSVANPADKPAEPAPAASPSPAGDASDPTTQTGKNAIKNAMGAGDARGMRASEAARVLSEAGAIVLMP